MEKRLLFHVKNVKINKFIWTYGLFDHNYRVAALSTLYLTVSGIIIPSLNNCNLLKLKKIDTSNMLKIMMFK